MWQYNYTDELYHYGIPGMRWGRRRFQNADGSLTPAGKKRYDSEVSYKDAKTQYKLANREARRAQRKAYGVKGIQESVEAKNRELDAYANMVTEKANYKKSRAKNADRAEFKSYVKSMYKSGLPGSAADTDGHSVAIYNRLVRDKGKEYADKVAVKVQNKAVTRIAGSAIAIAGAVAVSTILSRSSSNRDSSGRRGIRIDKDTIFYQ